MKNIPKHIVCFTVIGITLSVVAMSAAIGARLYQKNSNEQSKSGEIETSPAWRVHNQEQAVGQVVEIMGVPDQLRPGMAATLITLVEDNTPFLSEQVIGRPLWHVTIPKWRLELPSAIPGFEDRYERTFDILLDPINGNILKIASRWPEGTPEVAPEPPAWSAEEQMGRSGLEKYHRFPQEKPSISFLQALDLILNEGVGSALVAKQIIAHYVVQSRLGGQPRAVWAITLRGIPPMPISGVPGMSEEDRRRAVPERYRNHIRNVVDARTGEWLHAGTSPQPISTAPSPQPNLPPPPPSPPPTVTLDLSSPSDGNTVDAGDPIDWTITAAVSTGDNLGLSLIAVDLVQDTDNPELFDIPPGVAPAGMADFDRPNGISNPDPGGPGSA